MWFSYNLPKIPPPILPKTLARSYFVIYGVVIRFWFCLGSPPPSPAGRTSTFSWWPSWCELSQSANGYDQGLDVWKTHNFVLGVWIARLWKRRGTFLWLCGRHLRKLRSEGASPYSYPLRVLKPFWAMFGLTANQIASVTSHNCWLAFEKLAIKSLVSSADHRWRWCSIQPITLLHFA